MSIKTADQVAQVANPDDGAAEDRFGTVESVGVEYIPESERDSRPRNMFAVFFGGNLAFSVIVFGWIPITMGLSFWQAVSATTVGIAIGTLCMAPLSLMGPRTGTNNTVSSGAHFGVTGRMVGSALTLLFALAYAAVAIWTSGDALVAAAHRVFNTPTGNVMMAVGYGIIAVEIIAVALFGHGTVVALQKFVLPVVGVLLLLGIFAFAGQFHPGTVPTGAITGSYQLGDPNVPGSGFWPTWILSVAIAVGGPISYAPTLGDYSRRISSKRFSSKSVLGATLGGVFFGLLVTAVFGSYTAYTFLAKHPDMAGDYVSNLVDGAPGWYVLPIVIIALAGGLGQGVLNVYASGLDLEALIPKLKRVQTTLITSVLAVLLLVLGVFVFKAKDSIVAMTLMLNGLAAPWITINVAGFLVARKGKYDVRDLQVFNEGRRGGRYWFTGGWNLRAVVPWTVASIYGVLAVDTGPTADGSHIYAGPLSHLANGVDTSLLGSALIGVVGYLIALKVWPENLAPVENDGEVTAAAAEAVKV